MNTKGRPGVNHEQTSRTSQRMVRPWETPSSGRVAMEVSCQISETELLDQNLRARVVGQDEVIDALVCSYSRLMSALRDPSRPLVTALLLGPTGVGKTETGKALAQTLFGSERAMTRINCEQYAHAHELSKLLGSPPGYVGSDIEPLLSQHRIDALDRLLWERLQEDPDRDRGLATHLTAPKEGLFQSIVLFDEIEKAHPVLWNALLGILEDGELTLGDNSTTDFTRSIILMTSNVGSREMSDILDRRPVGFHNDASRPQLEPTSIRDAALKAARTVFPYEFLNRFDELLVYSALEREHLERILDKFLADLHDRTVNQAGVPLLIKVAPEAKRFIVDRGTDLRFGARPLRRAMEKELVDPLSRLIVSRELGPGDVVEVERAEDRLVFYRRTGTSTLVVA